MARKHDAERLLGSGLYPSQISEQMGISVKSVIQYLRTRVGEGSLRLSDLYFSWPPEKRELLQRAAREQYPDDRLLTSSGLCRDELALFQALRCRRVFSGDMYEHISETEIRIHDLVRGVLEREFGEAEEGWWRRGISASIRTKCAARREEDDEPCRLAYAYTTLVDLSAVISKNWIVFQSAMPPEYRSDRKKLERCLLRLNRIRNAVMHPVKQRRWTEDDFAFARRFSDSFGEPTSRSSPGYADEGLRRRPIR